MTQVCCPICSKSMNYQARSEWPDFPFCSLRCKRIDLGKWLNEGYRIANPSSTPEEQEEPPEGED